MPQHLFFANSSAVQTRLPILAHLAWAIAYVAFFIHGFGVTQVLPFLLQHLTAPFADFDGISIDPGLLPSFGHPSARFPNFILVVVVVDVVLVVVVIVVLFSLH